MAIPDSVTVEAMVGVILNAGAGILTREFAERLANHLADYLRDKLGVPQQFYDAVREIGDHNIAIDAIVHRLIP